MKIFLLLASFIVLLSCGKSKTGGGEPSQQMDTEPEGIFIANLVPVNKKISKNVSSVVTVSKYGDDFKVHTKFKNGPAGMHIQALYTGHACPFDDSNADGFIDLTEAEKDIGQILIPFDDDLSGVIVGNDFFPSSFSFDYERSTSFSLLISDLNPRDRNFDLEGKIVVIHGIPETQTLPGTVSSLGPDRPQKTIPIACGVLRTDVIEAPEVEQAEPPRRVQPRPRPKPPRYVEPAPQPEPPRRTIWGRIRDAFGRLWNRIRGNRAPRCSIPAGCKPQTTK